MIYCSFLNEIQLKLELLRASRNYSLVLLLVVNQEKSLTIEVEMY